MVRLAYLSKNCTKSEQRLLHMNLCEGRSATVMYCIPLTFVKYVRNRRHEGRSPSLSSSASQSCLASLPHFEPVVPAFSTLLPIPRFRISSRPHWVFGRVLCSTLLLGPHRCHVGCLSWHLPRSRRARPVHQTLQTLAVCQSQPANRDSADAGQRAPDPRGQGRPRRRCCH